MLRDTSRTRRAIGTAAAVLAVVGLITAAVGVEGDAEQRVSAARGRTSPTTVWLEVDPTTTTLVPTTTTAAVAAPPVTRRPRTAAAPKPGARPAAPAGRGTVLTISSPGIWALDVVTGGLVRLADPAPFDVAGTTVLHAKDTQVWATPVTGGGSSFRYSASGDERVEWIEAAPDGTAVLRLAKPMNGGSSLRFVLFGPSGEVRGSELSGSQSEWSGDGSVVVVFNWLGVTGFRPDGSQAWGPIKAPESLLTDLRVNGDGGFLTGQFNSNVVKGLDVSSGQWHDMAGVWGAVSFGAGRRLMGQQTPPPGWNGFDPRPIVVFDPTTGAVSPYTSSGSEPVWAPDQGHAVLLGAPLDGRNTFANYSFTVRNASGAGRWTLSAPGLRFWRDNDVHGRGPGLSGPQWSADGRYLVVGVT